MSAEGPALRVDHRGGCHCGNVQFTVRAPAILEVIECNCSICTMSAYLHLIVASEDFKLESDESSLTTYTFNTGAARHLFCSRCGIKSFYVPRSHPDGYSINARCLDTATIDAVNVKPFDGRHWESAIGEIT